MKKSILYLLSVMLRMSSCVPKPQTDYTSITQTAEEIMAGMVAKTLEAHAMETVKTPQLEITIVSF